MGEPERREGMDEGRRKFLQTSVYAAYATPVIVSMLVNKASAGQSWNHGGLHGRIPPNNAPSKDWVGPTHPFKNNNKHQ